MSITFDEVEAVTKGKLGTFDGACPLCSVLRKPHNQKKRTFRVWRLEPTYATFCCVHCGSKGYVHAFSEPRNRLKRLTAQVLVPPDDTNGPMRIQKARSIWETRQSIEGSIGERYLRQVRGYAGPIPKTIAFLPSWCGRPNAMVAAFGCIEGDDDFNFVENADAIFGVHITKLDKNGTGKAGTPNDKIMIGKPSGHPIVLSPPNDGLGLMITEGIEDGLSALSVAGTAVWVAGSASHLPRLADAVPDYFEAVTILADTDPTGLRNARLLRDMLRARSISATAVSVDAQEAAA